MPSDRRTEREDARAQQRREAVETPPAKAPEPERDRLQDELGNEGVTALYGLNETRVPDRLSLATIELQTPASMQLGGNDDATSPASPAPLADDPLENPFLTSQQDSPPGSLDPVDPDPLPDEDDVLLPPGSHPCPSPDPLEPSLHAIHAATAWAQEALGGPQDPLGTAWQRLVLTPAPVLSDPYGRGIFVRARTLALARQGLDNTDPIRMGRRLTLAILRPEVRARYHAYPMREGHLPTTAQVRAFSPQGPRTTGGRPGPIDLDLAARIERWFGPLPDPVPRTSVPSPLPDDDDEDPLGLDEVIEATLGVPDALEFRLRSMIETAERLAMGVARLRMRHGTGIAVLEARMGVANADSVVADLDTQTQSVLRLLVDIAEAARHRRVPPEGLHRGLTRAAKALQQAHQTTLNAMSRLVSSGLAPFEPSPPPPSHPYREAWSDGDADRALATAPTPAVAWLTRIAAGHPPTAWGDPPNLDSEACRLLVSAGQLARSQPEAALTTLGDPLDRTRGIGIAAAALTSIDALDATGRLDEARALQRRAVQACLTRQSPAACSLLARWRPR
ncbi:MAG: hypothetical protein AAGA48_36510 [Myxococcota bacterium]